MALFAGLDVKKFVIEVLGATLGGFISEQVVKHPEIFGTLGEYATPVAGIVVGLLGQYLEAQGTLPAEVSRLLEFAGAVTTGNWIYEYFKGSSGSTSARVVYIPPEQVPKRRYGIVV